MRDAAREIIVLAAARRRWSSGRSSRAQAGRAPSLVVAGSTSGSRQRRCCSTVQAPFSLYLPVHAALTGPRRCRVHHQVVREPRPHVPRAPGVQHRRVRRIPGRRALRAGQPHRTFSVSLFAWVALETMLTLVTFSLSLAHLSTYARPALPTPTTRSTGTKPNSR